MSRDNELLSGLKKYGMVAFDLSCGNVFNTLLSFNIGNYD